MKQFSQAVIEKIGNYAYVLKNPIDSSIFYIGKGVRNRVFDHVSDALSDATINDKLEVIRNIHAANFQVEYYILRHGLTSEREALEIESACIDLLGLDSLTNIVKGHDSWERGMKTIDEVVQYYDAKVITISEPAIILNINKLYKRSMSGPELLNITRSAWIVALKRREDVKYAFAAYRGLVREIYVIKPKSWKINRDGNRWEFEADVAEASVRDKYLNQSLQNYIKKGNQNPVRYTF